MLERRELVGGCAVTEEIWPGYRVSTGAYLTSLASGQSVDSTGGFVTGLLLDGHDALYVSIFEGGYGGDHVEKFQLLSPLVTK